MASNQRTFAVGDRFHVIQQAKIKLTRRQRGYRCHFKVDSQGEPVWIGGVRPTDETMSRVRAMVQVAR